jgi:hypothetical protein
VQTNKTKGVLSGFIEISHNNSLRGVELGNCCYDPSSLSENIALLELKAKIEGILADDLEKR